MERVHCLTIAGSDPSGGAGIQGDLKTFTVLGAYGMAVITALTAQNTREVRGVLPIPPEFVRSQLATVLDDVRCDAAKTGMLANAAIIREVAAEWKARGGIPLVVDPVMVSTSKARLLQEDAIDAVRCELMPLATVATPNSSEAAVLVGYAVETLDAAKRAAMDIVRMGARAALVTGGHLEPDSEEIVDVLATGGDCAVLRARRIDTVHTHGSGCALASAICVGLARGLDVTGAVELGRRFVRRAIEAAGPLGGGYGPVNHLGAQMEPTERW